MAFHYYNEYTDNTVNDIKTDTAVLEAGGWSRLLPVINCTHPLHLIIKLLTILTFKRLTLACKLCLRAPWLSVINFRSKQDALLVTAFNHCLCLHQYQK